MFTFLNSLIFKNQIFDSSIFFIAVQLPYIVFGIGAIYLFFIPADKNNLTWIKGLPNRVLKCIHAVVAVGGATLVSKIMKIVFHISRPFEGANGIHSLFPHSGGDSFPSGHATAFAALATIIYFHNKKAGLFFWICAIAISVSRVIAGVHYPADIVAGITIGALFGYLTNKIWVKIAKATTY